MMLREAETKSGTLGDFFYNNGEQFKTLMNHSRCEKIGNRKDVKFVINKPRKKYSEGEVPDSL